MELNREPTARADKAQRILESAKALFSSVGLKNTSIEDIASSAGLGKGTVYLYFKSKEEIFSTLATTFTKDLHTALDESFTSSATPTEKLQAYIETRIRYWERSYTEYGLTLSSLLEGLSTPTSEALRKQYVEGDITFIKNILDEGTSSGEFFFGNSARMAWVIHGMFQSLDLPWGDDENRMLADEKIRAFTTLLFNGLNSRRN